MKKFLCSAAFTFLLSIAHGTAPWDIYSIDISKRGQDFVAALTTAGALATSSGEVVIQTQVTPAYIRAPGIVNGVIPYVQTSTATGGFVAAPNHTLFIVPYNPNKSFGITLNTQYIIIGMEQIVTLAYRNTLSPEFPLSGFNSLYGNNVYPWYFIDPIKRAADIQSIATTLITSPGNYNGSLGISQVWILTTLIGPFYIPLIKYLVNGNVLGSLIPRVLSISVLSNSLLQITYQPYSSSFPWSVIVAAEQVQQIIYYPTNPPSS